MAFADGYLQLEDCAKYNMPVDDNLKRDPKLVIALGVTNSFEVVNGERVLNPALTYDHGKNWANMIAGLVRNIKQDDKYDGVTFAGEFDAEPGWWSFGPTGKPNPQPTFDWAEGYSKYYKEAKGER